MGIISDKRSMGQPAAHDPMVCGLGFCDACAAEERAIGAAAERRAIRRRHVQDLRRGDPAATWAEIRRLRRDVRDLSRAIVQLEGPAV